MRAILINAKDREISEVEVSSKNTLKDWYRLMDVQMVEVVHYVNLGEGNNLLVDEERLINGTEHGFSFGEFQFAGNGLIVGVDDEGESVSTTTPLKDVQDAVKWGSWNMA